MAKNKNLSSQFGTPEYFKAVAEGTQPPVLFATAREIWEHTYPGDLDAPYSQENSQGEREDAWYSDKHELYEHKLNDKPSLTNSIKNSGYNWAHSVMTGAHVTLRDDVLLDGHHRVVAMHEYHPDDFIPIRTVQ